LQLRRATAEHERQVIVEDIDERLVQKRTMQQPLLDGNDQIAWATALQLEDECRAIGQEVEAAMGQLVATDMRSVRGARKAARTAGKRVRGVAGGSGGRKRGAPGPGAECARLAARVCAGDLRRRSPRPWDRVEGPTPGGNAVHHLGSPADAPRSGGPSLASGTATVVPPRLLTMDLSNRACYSIRTAPREPRARVGLLGADSTLSRRAPIQPPVAVIGPRARVCRIPCFVAGTSCQAADNSGRG